MVRGLTIQERFEWFVDTLNSLSDLFRIENVDDIEYIVYENLDPDIRSSFSEENHDIFVKHGLESIEIRNAVVDLRGKALELIDQRVDAENIRKNTDWQIVTERAKLIRKDLNESLSD